MPVIWCGNFLLIAALIAATSLPASAAPPSGKNINEVTQLILNSYAKILFNKDVAGARADCESAQKLSRQFDPDPYLAGIVDICFSDVADLQKNKSAACGRLDSALKNFGATPASHPARKVLENQIKGAERRRAKLAC
ncbi:MAG: hypothetical protein WD207_03955 [Xanthobacteraceae bacterium]